MSSQYDARASLGRDIFGAADLGDRRRTARLVKSFDRMCAHPGGTLPDKLASPPDLRGLYHLCDADAVTHEAVIGPARDYARARIAARPGDVLVLHDAHRTGPVSLTLDRFSFDSGGWRGHSSVPGGYGG
jgi:hypothetical protein